jgi:S-DNA-T family DNA segregation ATPase FtsK/SpoIIIE
MKIAFTLLRSGGSGTDLVATVDATTTVGDLAAYLVAADPARQPAGQTGEVTLGVAAAPGGRAQHVTLDPRLPVGDSGLRSGAVVTISHAGEAYADQHGGPAAAVLRVLAGPDAGKEYPLPRGTALIGRERGCEVRLSDPQVSRQHARLHITDTAELVDVGSANGILLGGVPATRAVLRPGETALLGDTEITVRLDHRSGATTEAGTVAFVRSPCPAPRYAGVEHQAPQPPERPATQRFPVLPLLAPLLVGAALYLATRSVLSLLFIGLSPVMMLASAAESRLAGRGAYRQAVRQWRADLADLVTVAKDAAAEETAARTAEHPSTVDCLGVVAQRGPRLWTRRPGEAGFAELRLGLGPQPSRSAVVYGTGHRGSRELTAEVFQALAPFGTVEPVPVVAPLAAGALGVAGPRAGALPAARALIAQTVVLHSPAELALAGFASARTATDWDWLKWLPHCTGPHSPVTARLLASTQPACVQLLTELEDILEQRGNQTGPDNNSVPAVMVLVEDDAPVDHARLVQLAERGPGVGIHVLWLAPDTPLLPAACRTYLEVGPDLTHGTVGRLPEGDPVPVTLELLGDRDALRLAQQLAPVADSGAPTEDDSDLPRTVSLLALTGQAPASEPLRVVERWVENRSIATGPYAQQGPAGRPANLRAIVGQSAVGPVALDLRADGPHALVGGTTGAGKSELLQAWIAGLAAAHSPQRVTFLLVDYKGGSAFRDCNDLPHTVGLVTDLDPRGVRRTLRSLGAELRYREGILAKHRAKDLAELERTGAPDTPPSLVIVVDEFAALVHEVPEFVDGVVNVAQRGRSLGLHLILATQRPAGVIKDNLRANTNLRLALRMADESDSLDVLGSAQAAGFDPGVPGRAVCKSGPGRLLPFQAGYAGGWTSDRPPPPQINVESLTFGTAIVWRPPTAGVPAEPVDELGPTDLQRMVRTIAEASRAAQLPVPRKPCLPELPPVYDLARLPTTRTDAQLIFGIQDDPERQLQPTVAFHPDRDGNLAVYGTGGAGKSTLLRTLAIAAGYTIRGGPCHVYGLDFGSRGLAMLEELPHVGSIIPGADHERLTRLLGWLRTLIDDRALRYSRVNAATITEYRRLAGVPDEPRILLLVDGIAAFRQAYEASDRIKWYDLFCAIAADGRPVGVHAVLSADQRGAITTALGSAVQRRVVLRQAAADDYGMLGVPGDVLTPQSPQGRCLIEDAEVQVAVLGGTPDLLEQATSVRGFAESMRRAGQLSAPPILSLPDRVDLADLPATADGPALGMAAATLSVAALPKTGTFLISGPPGSGRSTALLTAATSLHRWRPDAKLCYFGPRRSPVAALPVWSHLAQGATAAADLARHLSAKVSGTDPADPDPNSDNAPLVVLIESLGDFLQTDADIPLQQLVKACLAADHLVIAEGEVTTLTSPVGLLGLLKSSRRGLALQPDQGDGSPVFRTPFPRLNRVEFPPGRALLVGGGTTAVIQVATPPADRGVLPIDDHAVAS